ncbi:DNA polymerase IV [Salinisphaera orenii]|uniref:DNA polymerase IV n=1 Tax=Salinisphaera orenii TaxID=856731 RepID=UPI00296F41EA
MSDEAPRRIIHVDMDAFYASVEQRDDPTLQGRPMVVANRSPRAVVTAASYEAREYGIRSAMPAMRAANLCPHAVFAPPDFARYRAVSRQIQAIFARFTPVIQPLSLDEAYLDVSAVLASGDTATAAARRIRQAIADETHLTASAGIAPNKFVAKIASDWRKPNGQHVVPPARVQSFLAPLPVGKIPGVGPAMRAKLTDMNIATITDLRTFDETTLATRFGRWGSRLYELARGHDERPVESQRPTAQISSEDTLAQDTRLEDLAPLIRELSDKVWARYYRKNPGVARTVTLKLKTADFEILTRAYTPSTPPESAASLAAIGCNLRQRVDKPAHTKYRLVGIGLSGFIDANAFPRQTTLFDDNV